MTSPYSGFAGAAIVTVILFALAVYVVGVIGLWKTFVKAGHPGWAAIIPYWNLWIWVKIAGRPAWWFWVILAGSLLGAIPVLGYILVIAVFVMSLFLALDVARNFGKSSAFGVGLWLLSIIFVLILGFGDAQYLGPQAAAAGPPTQPLPPAPLPPCPAPLPHAAGTLAALCRRRPRRPGPCRRRRRPAPPHRPPLWAQRRRRRYSDDEQRRSPAPVGRRKLTGRGHPGGRRPWAPAVGAGRGRRPWAPAIPPRSPAPPAAPASAGTCWRPPEDLETRGSRR